MKTKRILLISAAAAFTITGAQAHRAWIYPSSTVLSGDESWVTFDAAVSNNLFFADHHAPDLAAFTATGPDGKPVKIENGAKGKYRSTFDIPLTQQGTYKIGTERESVFAKWKEGEEEKTFMGSEEEFKAAGLEGKEGVTPTVNVSRTVTYVTLGEPNTEVLKPTGKGIEILFDKTHPNDLFAGETATFTLNLHGKPAAGLKVTVIKGDDRYRSEAGEIVLTTNDKGEFEVTWPEAGRFWLNVSNRPERPAGAPEGGPGKKEGAPEAGAEGKKEGGPQAGGPGGKGGPGGQGGGGRRGGNSSSYTAVFEVLPE